MVHPREGQLQPETTTAKSPFLLGVQDDVEPVYLTALLALVEEFSFGQCTDQWMGIRQTSNGKREWRSGRVLKGGVKKLGQVGKKLLVGSGRERSQSLFFHLRPEIQVRDAPAPGRFDELPEAH